MHQSIQKMKNKKNIKATREDKKRDKKDYNQSKIRNKKREMTQ